MVQLKDDVEELGLSDSIKKAKQFINSQKGARLDYLVAVDSISLNEVDNIDQHDGVAVVTVVEYEGVRLLDNIILK